ncbi:histone H2A-like [Ostrinia furnacalis]|uniref:histone H2A-like n=1 Tax=Ostrinia furnacalis TaxID=93504 RepID=UPI00103F26AF|nr:histone H2A-like [Ostrinia furnacalis]
MARKGGESTATAYQQLKKKKNGVQQKIIQKYKQSLTSRAGLKLPVSHVDKLIRQLVPQKINRPASIFLTAVLQYLCSELLVISKMAMETREKLILPRHIEKAILHDDEIARMLPGVIISKITSKKNNHKNKYYICH